MFERFTDPARGAVLRAQDEARRLGHPSIGTEHVLLGLLGEPGAGAGRILHGLGISADAVRREVVEIVGRGTEEPHGHIPFTPRAKKVLELSLREALRLRHSTIGSEHILLGLLREGEGLGAQVLVRRGADLDRVRDAVLADLSGRTGEPRAVTGRARRARTPAAERVLAAAEQLASGAPLGSHHLLEALVRSDESLGGRVLASLGVDADAVAARIDELGVEGTTDLTPEEAAARRMEVRVEGDEVHLVLRDDAALALGRAVADQVGGTLQGDDPLAAALVPVWQASVAALDDLAQQLAGEEPGGAAAVSADRGSIVQRALQSRRRRRSARTARPAS